MANTENKKYYAVYGVIGMVALFLMGALFGYIINGSDRVNHSTMSRQDCQNIGNQIILAARNNQPDLIEQLNKVYSENCLNREFEQPKTQPESKAKEQKLPETTCEAIEELLKHDLGREDSLDWHDHEYNKGVYEKLMNNGCAENKEKYRELFDRETRIANALHEDNGSVNMSTCAQIERVLIPQLQCTDGYEICENPDTHISNAKIYANLSERGCPENAEKYKILAKQELEIARALHDDSVKYSDEQNDAIEIVETYKRLQMQQEAERMIEKAKKLTNPAIDFIIQLEKIIEE